MSDVARAMAATSSTTCALAATATLLALLVQTDVTTGLPRIHGVRSFEELPNGAPLTMEPNDTSLRWPGASWRRKAPRRLQSAACDTVAFGDSAVDGDGMLANIVGRDGRGRDEAEADTTTVGPAVVGAYVDGEAISAELLATASGGTFACDSGWTLTTDATWVCAADGGAAMLSGQPCANGIPPEGGVQLFYIIFGIIVFATYAVCWMMGYEKIEKKEKVEDDEP